MGKLLGAGFVCGETLELEQMPGALKIEGEIACKGGIVISVFKRLETCSAGPDPEVRTVSYSYNAFVRGHAEFLRYDNAHGRSGHYDTHHRHRLDWRTGEEFPGSPEWTGEDAWPTLTEYVHEVEAWYVDHRDDLPDPDGVPELGSGQVRPATR
jgi:hypothetical protein